jgi:WD40 repeat protein
MRIHRFLFWACLATSLSATAQGVYLTAYKKINVSSKPIKGIAFSSSSQWFATSTEAGEVYIGSTEETTAIGKLPPGGQVLVMDFVEQDKSLLVLDKNGKLTRFDMTSRQPAFASTTGSIKLAALDPNQQYLSYITKESMLEVFDLKAGMTLGRTKAIPASSSGVFMGFDRFGQQVAVINKLGETVTWNILNQQLLRQLKLQSGEYGGSRSVIHAASTSFGGDHFMVGMQEVFIPSGGMQGRNQPERRNLVISYDWVSGQEYKRIPTKLRTDDMCLGPGVSAVISADSRTVSLINIERGEITSSVAVDEKPTAVSFSDDFTYLAVGTVSGNVYFYEVVRNNPLGIKITQPKVSRNYGDEIIKDTNLTVQGIVEGTAPVSRILVNGQVVQPSTGGQFSADVQLNKGKNRIKIEVENTDRSVTEKDIYVTCEPSNKIVKDSPAKVSSGKRFALVIGNGDYIQSAKLKNTVNDARSIEGALKELNFEVQTLYNASYEQMKEAVFRFGDRIQQADISLFYYAGHGLEVDGTNYLVPTDATINSALDVKLKAIPLTGITRTMEYANDEGLNMIILDACRNNPFPTGKRSSGSGLTRVQAPSGTLIAYATDPGSTASDGDGVNGLYTGELVKQLRVSQRIDDIFMNTRNEVERISNGTQRPWEEARLKGVFYLK